MSKKDFDDYLIKVESQYSEMKKNLESVAKEVQDNPSDLDFIETLKERIAPFKQNYERLMYVKYLLDKPVRKKKTLKYNRMMINKLKELEEKNSLESVLEENESVLNNMKKN